MNNKTHLKTVYVIIILALLLFAAALLSLRLGSVFLDAKAFFGGLFKDGAYATESIIIYSVRLPRVLGAVLAGIGLSVSGTLLQNITGNPLAGPNIIGVNSGAGFAAILLMFFFPSAVFSVPFAAFLGAFFTTLVIVFMASRINNSKSTVILAGVAITALLNAAISFISFLDTDILATYNYFSVGGLSGVHVTALIVPTVIITLGFVCALVFSKRIDTVFLGDSVARSLGVNVNALRCVTLIAASACAASVVSFAGLLGFVGLVVPHLSRKLVGFGTRRQLIVSAILGALLVVIADLVGRTLFAPSELPVGIVMAFVGAPFFVWLLFKRRSHADL